MIQQQQIQTYSFIPILQSASLEDNELPSYQQYSYDFYNKLLKQKSKFVNMDQLSYVPYYAGIVQIQNTQNYLITGGVIFTQDNTQEAFTTNQCLQLSITDESILFQTFDPLTQEDVIPQLIYPRHNHKVFQLKENNQNVFIAVGGSFVDNQGAGVLKTCEKLVQGSKNWVEIAPLSKNRTGFSGFVLNNKIYVFGGIETPGQAKQDIIPISIVEVYDIEQNKWEQIKYKIPLGISIGLESLCIPIDIKRILVLGGSKDRSSDQILIMDVEAKTFAKHQTKLNNPRAKAYGSMLKNVQTKQILRTENSENVVDSQRDLIVILGGNNGNQALDVYEINNEDLSLTFIAKQDLSKILDDSYEMHGLTNLSSWTSAFQSMPVLTLLH